MDAVAVPGVVLMPVGVKCHHLTRRAAITDGFDPALLDAVGFPELDAEAVDVDILLPQGGGVARQLRPAGFSLAGIERQPGNGTVRD